MSPRLSGHDVSFLERAAAGTPLNVGGLVRLAPSASPLTLERMRAVIAARLPSRFRQRVVTARSVVSFEDDAAFDIVNHVDLLPFRADDPDLGREISRLHALALDDRHPLWRLSLIAAGATGGPAMFFRASHAVVDGSSSMQVMRALFDRPPATRPAAPPDSPSADDVVEVVRDIWATMRPGSRRSLEPQEYERALALLDGWISMLERGWHGGPRFGSNGPVRTRVAFTELDQAGLRGLRRQLGARFDVVGLTVTAAAIGRLFAARREQVAADTKIRTLVPVAASAGGRRSDLGNRASFLLVTIPVGKMDPLVRLRQIADEVSEAIASGQHVAASLGMRALEHASADVTEALWSFTEERHFVDLVVSCVPGSRRPLSFDGIRHEVTFPILPITRQLRLAVGFGDIAGRLGVAVTADESVLPEVDFFVDALRRSSAELIGAAR